MNYTEFVQSLEQSQREGTDWQGIICDEYPRFAERYWLEDKRKAYAFKNKTQNFKQNFKNRQIMKRNNNQGSYNSQNYGNSQKQIVKHSGAKTTKYFPKTGPNAGVEQYLTSGWKLADGALISIRCVTTSKSKLSDKGWLGSIACSMTNTKTGVSAFHWGTMQASTGKVVINDVAMVLNPRAKNGGYAGTFLGK